MKLSRRRETYSSHLSLLEMDFRLLACEAKLGATTVLAAILSRTESCSLIRHCMLMKGKKVSVLLASGGMYSGHPDMAVPGTHMQICSEYSLSTEKFLPAKS